jgi:hypothetical protein
MEPREVVTVRDARRNISRILSDLQEAGSQAEPVFIGAHRKAEGVLMSIASYRELEALRERFQRGEAVASAWGSLRAEGLEPSAQFVSDAAKFTSGQIDADELVRRAIVRHRR